MEHPVINKNVSVAGKHKINLKTASSLIYQKITDISDFVCRSVDAQLFHAGVKGFGIDA